MLNGQRRGTQRHAPGRSSIPRIRRGRCYRIS